MNVLPESLQVIINEYDTFFTVDIKLTNVEVRFETLESVLDGNVELGEDDETDWESHEPEVNEIWVPSSHEHTLFFHKDASYSLPRDEILMKLKLAFPNHIYELNEAD